MGKNSVYGARSCLGFQGSTEGPRTHPCGCWGATQQASGTVRLLLELPHHPHPTSAHSCPRLHLPLQTQEAFCYPPLRITDLFSVLNSNSLTHMTTVNNCLKRYARNYQQWKTLQVRLKWTQTHCSYKSTLENTNLRLQLVQVLTKKKVCQQYHYFQTILF